MISFFFSDCQNWIKSCWLIILSDSCPKKVITASERRKMGVSKENGQSPTSGEAQNSLVQSLLVFKLQIFLKYIWANLGQSKWIYLCFQSNFYRINCRLYRNSRLKLTQSRIYCSLMVCWSSNSKLSYFWRCSKAFKS